MRYTQEAIAAGRYGSTEMVSEAIDALEMDERIAQAEAQIKEEKAIRFAQRVQNALEAIQKAEGYFHSEGRYYADLSDAERMQRMFAERIVRENMRHETRVREMRGLFRLLTDVRNHDDEGLVS